MICDTVLIVDWSGGNDRGPSPKKDAIWACVGRGGDTQDPLYFRNRQLAETWISDFLTTEHAAGRRVLAGFDFAFGYPAGFGQVLTGSNDPFAIWDWFATRVQDTPKQNNRFDLAGEINALFAGIGPFWGNGLANRDIPNLPRKGRDRTGHGMPEKRYAEQQATGAFPVWQLAGAGAVGSQVIMGLPMLARLRQRFAQHTSVWPFEPATAPIILAEVWPSLISKTIAATQSPGQIKDAHQVATLAQILSALSPDQMQRLFDTPTNNEGAILGQNHPDIFTIQPPRLRNDCFAITDGAHWTPVDDALQHLKQNLTGVVGTQTSTVENAAGRYLARDAHAARAHPPARNAAVDGYGFAGPAPDGLNAMALVDGRSAAGQPFAGHVPAGYAIRIMTGANLPAGVDTVILQEDITTDANKISFHGPLQKGANARAAGEDMQENDMILPQGRQLNPGDLAMLTAAGVSHIQTHTKLRVGILSTGDELCDADETADTGQIYDANRPMLRSMVTAWGHNVIDLGRAADNRHALRTTFNKAAADCDVMITSGGASAGEEDHVSALLKDTGAFALWRVAIKPGRPLALGMWNNTPVIGLPGNPVATMICALLFARPALHVMAGGSWITPQGFQVPAGFNKTKQAGRREYLRARIENGRAIIFASQGSGRISGLSWATGLVVLDDPAQKIAPDDLITYIPFGSFGL